MSSFDFSQWPPQLSDVQLETLKHHATTYAFAHGLNSLPPAPGSLPPSPSWVIHAPISLIPTPFPRTLFEKVQRLQSIYNHLYARIASDVDFLDQVMGAEVGIGQVDDFVRRLWMRWKAVRDEGIVQPLHLCLFRADYLLHSGEGPALDIKQVEINTVASSFGALSQRTAAMHRYLHALTDYYHISPQLKPENFPPNESISGLASGLAEAHKAYNVSSAYILFVIQENERNVFDQRLIEYELLEKYGIRSVRQTFVEIDATATISGPSRTLFTYPSNAYAHPIEISTVYYRTGYRPADYPTEIQWKARLFIERTRAIKCPTLPLQLAGGKKIQEFLTQPGVVERFFTDWEPSAAASAVKELRETWMPMWALDAENPPPPSVRFPKVDRKPGEPFGTTLAHAHAEQLVLKPQREGGGHNFFKGDIHAAVDALPEEERSAWIAMALITPPAGVSSYLLRPTVRADGTGLDEEAAQEKLVRIETVSELGIYGWVLFGNDEGNGVVRQERGDVGWLMRTKVMESDEGGVAAGFSVLDSVVLIDE